MNPLTLDTHPLATGEGCPHEAFLATVYQDGKQPAYDRPTMERIANSFEHWCQVFSDDGRTVAGQVFEETDFFRFTGDVRPNQYNFGGIGTTGGGVVGESYPTPEDGALAVLAHRSVYYRGQRQYWNPDIQQYWNASHRYAHVVAAGYAGTCSRIGDLGSGKWAMNPLYANNIVVRGNMMGEHMTATSTTPRPLRFAIGAGHHNTSGGNPEEIALTGPLTKQYVDTARSWGVDVRCYTPNDGLGMYPGGLHEAVNTVNKWAANGWTPDMLMEVHYQGLKQGSDAGHGFFCIYPDWDNDVDITIRDKFIPIWVPHYQTGTTMLPFGDGGMSEKRTGVGLDGDRLGVFSTTVGLKNTTSRCIVEHGCHTCPTDHALIVGPNYNQQVVDAFLTAWFEMEGRPLPTHAPFVPSGPGGTVDGFYLVKPFWDAWNKRGDYNHPDYGLITSGMVLASVDGKMRYLQFTEKGALACYPQDMPDGVPESSPWFIRNLKVAERIEALASAKAQGLVPADLL